MFHDPDATYVVVVNDEEQYSLWLEGKPLPDGWKDCGFKGSKAECLEEISRVWSDLRPKSLRGQ